ncbi:YvrJ family protein [Hathewaya histolytica]|uniref:Membrane-associated protein n=1 Tax=Hathewaya histolytica TaxID=1498 RepID=A0A4U9QVC4_HATHI|nr:YvrJ family protein [Hathewaya histolytica]VTQ82674.1 membrane-associated protein [Hathewaya histolytica]
MEKIVALIGNLGFPIAVSIYLLTRIEAKLEKLTESINALSNSIVSFVEQTK